MLQDYYEYYTIDICEPNSNRELTKEAFLHECFMSAIDVYDSQEVDDDVLPKMNLFVSNLMKDMEKNNHILKLLIFVGPTPKTYDLKLGDFKVDYQSLRRLIARKDLPLKTFTELSEFILPYKEPCFELAKLIVIYLILFTISII